ncbi:type I restriction enzyme, R subunit [Granulicatella balaenopterae]|uniref:Type I restriction enzyme endonuclease subunit n=1 Tax=Granulicatella balaenopterae TaxID=137733 RepID=A0A1H9NJ47_9LACT|nr:HsdR family type I site-specific deoxyribonuclease [Granulicatella balaenopterae]SER35685.1 type I restriction enzyme, R subunit [Granulicatella balaenopterae]
MNEDQFEKNLIEYLSTGKISPIPIEGIESENVDYVYKSQLWKYEPNIKTTEDLWENFREIIFNLNQKTLEYRLSETEFAQVKNVICNLNTPYEAGQFLYGLNGTSQIEIDLDNGKHVILTIFDQKQIGAGDTVYQVVNQIQRPAKIAGKQNRRFDTTLLINGLPIIQIEEKVDTHDVNEALNQMHQYIDELQYRDIFSTLQILVAITPNNVKYMANTTSELFNKDFAFNWQRKSDNQIVRNWKEFADSMLSIPMAHKMATNFMILDGTKNKQMLKVMRPYQVYATQNVINGIKNSDFELGNNKIGYVWHTTGSGKTITSFKTAWLASRMPQVDKVVFVVDRIALTKQTSENYQAYDPDGDSENNFGSVNDTQSTTDLRKKLRSKGNGIIVTSVQKLGKLVKRKNFKSPDKNILFIVDEAHRSTAGTNFNDIQKAFKKAAWVGYTGTPMFDDTTKGLRTQDIFGPMLHAYTIREAIADRNVLGFKVDFETTIPDDEIREHYLPVFYREKYPKWSDEKIQNKIDSLSPEDMDDTVESSFYDENEDHVRLVVEDIFKNWRNRSNNGKYNAMLTTHVGGGKASTPMAMMYYNEFQRINKEHEENGGLVLKVAVTFSQDSSNSNHQLDTNKGLFKAINEYNKQFDTKFEMADASAYTQDVASRLNRTATDKKYLDLVIVVDQLLTGFDAPEMNTLYVDRTLRGAGLIQAYSRTNRIADMQEKPWGRIVNYRWPKYNEKLMKDALAIYANKASAESTEAKTRQLQLDGVLAEGFKPCFDKVKAAVNELRELTDDFVQLPASEQKKEEMLEQLREYNKGMAMLKQYDPEKIDGEMIGFNYENPDELIEHLGITPEQHTSLTTVLTNELKESLAEIKQVPVYEIELRMTHVKDIKVNYDYLTELVQDLMNQIHEKEEQKAKETFDKIMKFADGLDDRQHAQIIKNAAEAILNGDYPSEAENIKYPVSLDSSDNVIQQANKVSLDLKFQDFRIAWGLMDVVTNNYLHELFSSHKYGEADLDDMEQIQTIATEGSLQYKTLAYDEKVKKLSKIRYRNALRTAIYDLADEVVQGY